jgi:hypothetical protein
MSAAVTPHVKAVRCVELKYLMGVILTMMLGLSTDAPSDSPSTGRCSEISGEVRLSTFAPSSMPTEMYTILDDKEYVWPFELQKQRKET